MRRAEMARRRKNLSEKRNEEEKVSLTPDSTSYIYLLASSIPKSSPCLSLLPLVVSMVFNTGICYLY